MRKKRYKKIDTLLSFVIVFIFIPLFVAIIGQRMQLEELIYGESATTSELPGTELKAEQSMQDATEQQEKRNTDTNAVYDEEIEQRLIGIVAKEIEADAERDAVLAQCVIARTNLCDAIEKHTEEPEALSVVEMQNLWGAQFAECYQRLETYVMQTKGEVLWWEGDYAYAAYHAVSAGSTRNMEELYSDVQMPYLKAQDCAADVLAEDYLEVAYWEKGEFVQKCNELFAESDVDGCEDILIESRDEAGYVLAMKIGNVNCDGETFRTDFGLSSACFTITEIDENIRIVTKGVGHGFGLSQNMADEMAKDGCGYEEILTYFFPGTTIETV